MTKRCTKCGEVKSLEEFHKNRAAKDGLQNHCKSCIAEYGRKRYAERGDEIRASVRTYRAENREKVLEAKRAHYAEHAEEEKARVRRWREENPHKAWESDYRKRCRAAGQIPVVRSFTREELVEFWGNGERCIYCDGPFEEIDHLFPVSLGGAHSIETVAPSCSGCNRAGGQHARNFLRQMSEQERYVQVVVGAARARLALIA